MSVPSEYHGSDVSSSRRNSYKLFVGCISYDVDEAELLPIFESFGEIVELSIQRDREGRSRGCAWLKYSTQDACENCVATLSNKYYVNGMRSPIVVKYANTQEEQGSAVNPPISKLFVGGFPTTATDAEIRRTLEMFGGISVFERLSRMGIPTGPVFVTFVDSTSAMALLNANTMTIFMEANTGDQTPITLRVSAAFSPVRQANYAPSVSSSSESPVHRGRTPTVIFPSSAPVASNAPATKLFVGCLPYSRSSQDLSDLFSHYGSLVEVALLTTPDGKSKGAAFVTFVNRGDAERALTELQGYCFPNSSRGINISFATKQARPGAPPAGKAYQGSPSGSAATYAPPMTEEPSTPPGFFAMAERGQEKSKSSSNDLLSYLSNQSESSPFSILRRNSEDALADMDKINRELLGSIFGEISGPK